MNSKFIVFLLLVPSLGNFVYAQSESTLGSYEALSLDIHLKNKWSLYVESEMRSIYPLSDHYYYEVKAGMSYKLNGTIKLTAAFGVYNTFRKEFEQLGIKKNVQYRFWQQAVIKQNFFLGNIEHRVRLEEVLNQNFKPRLRYRLQPKWPLKKNDFSAGTFFATMFDEIFLQTENPVLVRNRIFGGLGYKPSGAVTLQVGILKQSDYKISDNYRKNFIYLSGSVGI